MKAYLEEYQKNLTKLIEEMRNIQNRGDLEPHERQGLAMVLAFEENVHGPFVDSLIVGSREMTEQDVMIYFNLEVE